MRKHLLISALFALTASPAFAQDVDEAAFLEANVLSIFYHELGHAAIVTEDVPIFGQEEDAADTFSIFMIDALYEEDTAYSIAFDAALGFIGEAEARDREMSEVPWWDVHGPDEQRFYNTVCLFYGADPETRADFAQDMDLPEERADYCPDEYDQANASWGAVLDDMSEIDGKPELKLQTDVESEPQRIIAAEVENLNKSLRLSEPVTVKIESCDEANAFFEPADMSITFCTEFEAHLRELFKKL